MSTATLKDVAEAAGVSLTTVSQSLSGKGNVSDETRQKVAETAENLGYRRTVSQKTSVNSQLLSIGLTFDISASTNHNWRYLRSFIEECQNNIIEKGGSFLLIPYNHGISEEENIRCIEKANIRGIISFSLYSESFLSSVEKRGVPVVVYNDARAHNRFMNVALDDFQSTLDAINYLIKLGHQSIMFAYTERHNLPDLSNNRFFAYRKALEDANMPLRENLVVHIDVESVTGNVETIKGVMDGPDPPTAALCLDDDLAAGLLFVMNDLGYSVPEDLSLIAHGDMLDYSRFQTPRITTMRMDPVTSSKIAVELLIERLKGPRLMTQTVKVQEHMQDRGSCIRVVANSK